MGDITMRTYSDELERFVCFLLRNNADIYPLELTSSVVEELQLFHDTLADSDSKDEELMLCLQNLLISLWTHSWSKSNLTKVTTDPTILFFAFRMLLPQSGFREAGQATPVDARLVYCFRLIFVLEMLRHKEDSNWNATEECNRLEKFFTEKNDYTFNSLRDIQHIASAIAYNQKSLPRVVWIDRTHWDHMLYLGDPIRFLDLCQVFHNLERDIVQMWEEKIMLGTGLGADILAELLKDNLTEKEPGYSMFTDQRNQCFKDRNQLLRLILTTPALCARFVVGWDTTTNSPKWNKVGLRGWLYNYSQFHLLLMMRWQVLSGSPMRGTELVSVLFQNTQTRARNLVAIAYHLALVAQYNKTGAFTGVDKLVPHAGDALTSSLTVQDLALARPFAQFIAHICYRDDAEVIEAYRDLLFVKMGRAFDSDELSDGLSRYTSKVLKVRLGLNAFRHVSIAFRRMLVDKATEQEVEGELMRQVEAEQAGHSESVEQSVYAVSTDSIGEYSDQMLGVFCDASARWQNKCGVVPTGVGLFYSKCQAKDYQELRSRNVFSVDEPESAAESKTKAIIDAVMVRIQATISESMQSMAAAIVVQLQNPDSLNHIHTTSHPPPSPPICIAATLPPIHLGAPPPPIHIAAPFPPIHIGALPIPIPAIPVHTTAHFIPVASPPFRSTTPPPNNDHSPAIFSPLRAGRKRSGTVLSDQNTGTTKKSREDNNDDDDSLESLFSDPGEYWNLSLILPSV